MSKRRTYVAEFKHNAVMLIEKPDAVFQASQMTLVLECIFSTTGGGARKIEVRLRFPGETYQD